MLTISHKQGALIAVAILCAVSCFTVRFPVLAQDSDSTKSKLTSLLKERRDVLTTRVEMVEQLVRIGASSHEALISAREDLLKSEFELAVDTDQRIAVLQRKLDNARQLEALMRQRKEDARGTEVEVMMAKAGRLGVEIELLRETERRGQSR